MLYHFVPYFECDDSFAWHLCLFNGVVQIHELYEFKDLKLGFACDFFLQVLGRAIAAGPALSWCMAGAVMGVLEGCGSCLAINVWRVARSSEMKGEHLEFLLVPSELEFASFNNIFPNSFEPGTSDLPTKIVPRYRIWFAAHVLK